jgi:hypothetical protein
MTTIAVILIGMATLAGLLVLLARVRRQLPYRTHPARNHNGIVAAQTLATARAHRSASNGT